MHKYMTIHQTETGDHANFFQHLENAQQFYQDMIGYGYPVILYGKDENGTYWMKRASWIEEKEAECDA